MAEIQFEEEQQYRRYVLPEQKSFMIRLVLSTGIVSTNTAAKYILIGIVIIAILASFFIFYMSDSSSPKIPSGARIIGGPGEPPRLAEPVAPR